MPQGCAAVLPPTRLSETAVLEGGWQPWVDARLPATWHHKDPASQPQQPTTATLSLETLPDILLMWLCGQAHSGASPWPCLAQYAHPYTQSSVLAMYKKEEGWTWARLQATPWNRANIDKRVRYQSQVWREALAIRHKAMGWLDTQPRSSHGLNVKPAFSNSQVDRCRPEEITSVSGPTVFEHRSIVGWGGVDVGRWEKCDRNVKRETKEF